MLSEPVQYKGKAGFLKLNFQDGTSQNTAKCELGWFLLRQSHITTPLSTHVHQHSIPYTYHYTALLLI